MFCKQLDEDIFYFVFKFSELGSSEITAENVTESMQFFQEEIFTYLIKHRVEFSTPYEGELNWGMIPLRDSKNNAYLVLLNTDNVDDEKSDKLMSFARLFAKEYHLEPAISQEAFEGLTSDYETETEEDIYEMEDSDNSDDIEFFDINTITDEVEKRTKDVLSYNLMEKVNSITAEYVNKLNSVRNEATDVLCDNADMSCAMKLHDFCDIFVSDTLDSYLNMFAVATVHTDDVLTLQSTLYNYNEKYYLMFCLDAVMRSRKIPNMNIKTYKVLRSKQANMLKTIDLVGVDFKIQRTNPNLVYILMEQGSVLMTPNAQQELENIAKC